MSSVTSDILLGNIQYKKTTFVAATGSGVSGTFEQSIFIAPTDVLTLAANTRPFLWAPIALQITNDNTSTGFGLDVRQYRRDVNDTAYLQMYSRSIHSGAVTSSLSPGYSFDMPGIMPEVISQAQNEAVPTGYATSPSGTQWAHKSGQGMMRLAPGDDVRIGGSYSNVNGTITVLLIWARMQDTRIISELNEWF